MPDDTSILLNEKRTNEEETEENQAEEEADPRDEQEAIFDRAVGRAPGEPLPGREFASPGMKVTAERLLENVRDEFEDFIKRASYLDLYLLYEVLNQHSGITLHLAQHEGTLADAFMSVLAVDAPATEEQVKRTDKGDLK